MKIFDEFYVVRNASRKTISFVEKRIWELSNRIASEDIELLPGGMILLSTDVNATAGKGFLSKIKSWIRTTMNRIRRLKRVDEEVKRVLKEEKEEAEKEGRDIIEVSGWTIGNLYNGRYYDRKNDQLFNEKSFSIDIRGLPFKIVRDIGIALGRRFNQESILIINHDRNKPVLVDIY